MEGRMLPWLRKSRHEHEEAHKMIATFLRALNLNKAVPKLVPLRHFPTVVPLKDGDYVLTGSVENLAKRFDRRFHPLPLGEDVELYCCRSRSTTRCHRSSPVWRFHRFACSAT